jgi:hypothetical protein
MHNFPLPDILLCIESWVGVGESCAGNIVTEGLIPLLSKCIQPAEERAVQLTALKILWTLVFIDKCVAIVKTLPELMKCKRV